MIAPPQTGVAALLKNPPAPGEAQGIQQAIPAMQPKASAPTSAPQSFVTPLKGRDLHQLLQEFNNPQSQYPKYAVLTAMKDRQEADRLKSALQGQGAMQQAKQQGTVADAIVAGAQAGMPPPPRMMATGGPVAFDRGGSVTQADVQQAYDAWMESRAPWYLPEPRGNMESRQLEEKYAQLLQDFQAGRSSTAPTAPAMAAEPTSIPASAATRVGTEKGRATNLRGDMRAPGIGALVPPTDKLGASSSAASRMSSATRAPTGIAPEDNSGTLKAYEQANAALKGQMTLPPELTKSYEGLAKMREQQLAEERAAAQAYGKSSLAARDAALAKADTPLLRDPRGLLAIAAGIDTGKGKGFKSLAASTEKYLGGKDAAKTAAAEKYELSQEKLRGMETINRQMAVLNKEKDAALLRGDVDRVNQLQQAISKLALERENFLTGRKDKAFEQNMQERKLASEAADRASREAIAKIEAAARNNPQSKEALALARVQAAINSSPLLKALADKAKFDPAAAAQYATEEERLYLRLAPELLMEKSGGATASNAAADDILKKSP